jgi:hypothetical protein
MAGKSELMMNCRLCTEKTKYCKTIKVKRLEWAGHVVRMSDDRTVKKVFLGKSDGRRKAGRPKLRWLDSIVNDEIDVCQEMEEESKDRSAWAIILKETPVKLKDITPKEKKKCLMTHTVRKCNPASCRTLVNTVLARFRKN